MPWALPVCWRFKSLECTQLANKWDARQEKSDATRAENGIGPFVFSQCLRFHPGRRISGLVECSLSRWNNSTQHSWGDVLWSRWLLFWCMSLQRLGYFLSSSCLVIGLKLSFPERIGVPREILVEHLWPINIFCVKWHIMSSRTFFSLLPSRPSSGPMPLSLTLRSSPTARDHKWKSECRLNEIKSGGEAGPVNPVFLSWARESTKVA